MKCRRIFATAFRTMKKTLTNALVSLEEARDIIAENEPLSIAGTEALLDQLPAGNWIGGTSSYFMTDEGGVHSADRVFVTQLPEAESIHFAGYASFQLRDMMADAPTNGFSLVVMPSGSETLRQFARGSRFWDDIIVKPVVGWIAGIRLEELGRATPKVYLGTERRKMECGAVVAHVSLPKPRMALVETVNIFERDESSVIEFDETASQVVECVVNGERMRFIDFLESKGNRDGTLPIVGDFGGANINVSIQRIDRESGVVKLFAPVFSDVDYYLARSIDDYAARFEEETKRRGTDGLVFSCNCILNYLYGKLEGKRTGDIHGPITFGEVAYLLHNQTMVLLRIIEDTSV